MNRFRSNFLLRLLSLCFLCLLMAGCRNGGPETSSPKTSSDQEPFILNFLTIGKGDAFLLQTPKKQYYLIDTGKSQDYVQIARALRVKNIAALNGIFLTHGHKDHIGSLDTLLQAFPTEAVYYWEKDKYSYHEILPEEIVPKYSAELLSLEGGEILDLGGVTAEIWLPPMPDTENENNNSLVLMLTHGRLKFLMMGDAEQEEEALLLQSSMDLSADVLKLGHHGEEDASSPVFLQAAVPQIGLITGNLEENPESVDPVIAERLRKRNIKGLYSESPGLGYEIISDGTNLEIRILKDRSLPKTLRLSFAEVDRPRQKVTIRNDDLEKADLSGCLIRSVRRDELFLFPEGTHLNPGQTISVACRDASSPGDLTWDADSVWQEKRDPARLYDRNLNKLAENIP